MEQSTEAAMAQLRAERDEAQRAARQAAIMMHLVVKAAGGTVTVPEKLMTETVVGEQLQRIDDPATGAIVFTVER